MSTQIPSPPKPGLTPRAASPAQAIAMMVPGVRPVEIERTDLGAARGRVLAHDIACDRDSPAFDYSSMDGYAVRSRDVAHGALPVVGEVRIGSAPPPMPGEPGAIRIVTGGAIPPGADCVIRREDVVEHHGPDGASVVRIDIHPDAKPRITPGAYIRRRGENARAGDAIVEGGTVLSATGIGAAASAGEIRPRVFRRVRIAVITTGDECVPPTATPGPFEIRDASALSVPAILAAHAWIDIVMRAHIRDNQEVLVRGVRDALERADAVILTGGVSKGHRDGVRAAIEAAGGRAVFHGVPQRPGNPMLGATGPDGQPIFGLPGNPVSSMVTCARIVLPVLGARAGIVRWPSPPRVRLANPDGKTLDLWWHRLVRMDAAGDAVLVDVQGSGDIIGAGRSDGFIEVPPGGADPGGGYPYHAWPV